MAPADMSNYYMSFLKKDNSDFGIGSLHIIGYINVPKLRSLSFFTFVVS